MTAALARHKGLDPPGTPPDGIPGTLSPSPAMDKLCEAFGLSELARRLYALHELMIDRVMESRGRLSEPS